MNKLLIIFIVIIGYILLTNKVSAPINHEIVIKNDLIDVETIVTTYQEPIDPWSNIPKESNIIWNPLLNQKGSLRQEGGYVEGECELAAKMWQKEYGGELVFIIPYNVDTNQWITGKYVGAWINKKSNTYYDYFNQKTFESKDDVIFFYEPAIQQKLNRTDISLKVFILGVDTIPFSIQYNY